MNKRSGRGFTIVELLIVIVVIGILATIVIVAFNGIQDRSRNTARLVELKGYEKLFQVYKNFNGAYPVASGGTSDRYCLGTNFPTAAQVNAAFTANGMTGAPGASTVSGSNPDGYCRDLFYGATRHEVNTNLNNALKTMGSLPSPSSRSLSDMPAGLPHVGPFVQYDGADGRVKLQTVFSGSSCPAGLAVVYPYSEYGGRIIMCQILLPE